MNLLERELHYPLGDALPEPGSSMEVAPGVRWIRMVLPFALNHINLWLLRDEIDGVQGWSIVDCCISREESRAQWEQVFATQLEGLPVLRVIVTHMHPDHIGLANWLCTRWNVPLWMSSTDYHVARMLCDDGDSAAGGDAAADFFASHGLVDPDALAKLRARTSYYSNLVAGVPRSFVRIMDGDDIVIGGRAWRCISGYGHAPEHISLYCAELNTLLGGDMMLPRISSNVSVYAGEPEANPLRMFLESIARFRSLPVDVLGLPSHGKPFTGVHRRVEQLEMHHRDHLAALLDACLSRPHSAADALPILFKRELDLHQMTFAMGEAVAHLHYLRFNRQLKRTLGEDGIYRFGAPAH
ncbi:MBL fold metallo-hydrolase [Variovorax sp. J22R133]|uniref:MBL fold metallo-hydrolase n=1 Tax=Variovorax brevis TaxID=3053503 RepID=UPI0025758F13|nr:MBL fold metallo-hydrolase [Variovorax sp. J22R133]MDM0114829.1 MBL fold metallo-hydrolase [Variovorax sp. J22R133]